MKFDARSGTQPDDAFIEGFCEDLIAELARHRNLNVISRHSSFALAGSGLPANEMSERLNANFLIDGRVGYSKDELLVDIEVYDRRHDRVVQVGTYRSNALGLGDMRDEMFSTLATTILGQVQVNERLVLTPQSVTTLDPYFATLRVLARKKRYTPKQYQLARLESVATTQHFPDYAPGWIAKGFVDYLDAVNSLTGKYATSDLADVEQTVRRGLSLDASIPMGWHLLSLIKGSMNEPAAALNAAQQAHGLAPRDPETLLFLSKAMLSNGRIDEAEQYLSSALPGYPILPSYVQLYRARTSWAAGRLQESVNAANDCITQAPRFTNCWIQKAVSLYEIGDNAGLAAIGEHLNRIAPAANQAMFIADFQSQEPLRSRLISAAAAIGIEE